MIFESQEEAEAWDRYAAAAMGGYVTNDSGCVSASAALNAAADADALLEARRKRFALRCGACGQSFEGCCEQRQTPERVSP